MTLAEVKVLRDKYYAALVAEDATKMDHSIEGASYSPDGHRESLQKMFDMYDKLYNLKLYAGRSARLIVKAV